MHILRHSHHRLSSPKLAVYWTWIIRLISLRSRYVANTGGRQAQLRTKTGDEVKSACQHF